MDKLHVGITPWDFSSLSAKNLADQAVFVEDLGYDSFWLPENHFGENAIPDPLTLLGAISGVTNKIKLGTTSYLLTLRNPIQAAEQVAVLDHLCEGRLILGVGRGFAPEMLKAFHVPIAEKRKIFAWTLELMRDAWLGKKISLDGNLEEVVPVYPRPLQTPHPPIWVAAFGPKALAQAGRMGLPYLCSPMESIDTLLHNYEMHLTASREESVEPASIKPLMRTVFVSNDQAILSRVKQEILNERKNSRPDSAETIEDWTLIGEPKQVSEMIQTYRERIGMTHLIATRPRIKGVDQSIIRESVRLMAQVSGDL